MLQISRVGSFVTISACFAVLAFRGRRQGAMRLLSTKYLAFLLSSLTNMSLLNFDECNRAYFRQTSHPFLSEKTWVTLYLTHAGDEPHDVEHAALEDAGEDVELVWLPGVDLVENLRTRRRMTALNFNDSTNGSQNAQAH